MKFSLLGWLLIGMLIGAALRGTPSGAAAAILLYGNSSGNPMVIQTNGSNALKIAIQ